VEGAKGECVRAGTDWAARGGGSRQRLPALGRCESGDAVFKGGVFQPFRRLQDFSCEGRATQKRVARTHRPVLRNHWLLRGRWWHMVPSCCCASPPSTNAEDAHGKGSSTCLLLQQQQRQRSRLMVLVVAVTTTQLWRRHHSAAQQQQQPCSGGGRSGQQSIAAQPQPSLQVVRLPVAWQASCASFSSKNVCTATLREDVLQLGPELDRATSHEHKEQQQQQLYSVQQHHHS